MRTSGDPIHVLHVDDEPAFAEMVATFLEREDERFIVETATDPAEGRRRLSAGDYDCVVSDYDMSGENGIEFLETVRETYPELPFLLYTGKGSEAVASDAISAGVTDYLQKERGTSQYAVLANRITNSVETYRTQTELADRERRLTLFFEQSPLGVIEWDDAFDLVRMNGAAEGVLGYAEDELQGRSWEVLVPESDREAVREVVRDVLENRGGFHSVNENVRKDGEHIVCEWHNRVVTDGADEIVAIFSQFQDITNRKAQKRRLETIIDTIPGIVYQCTNEPGWPMEYLKGEVEEITGYPASAIESKQGFYGTEVIHPADRDDVWRTVQTALDANEPFECTYRIATSDGETKWVWERGQGIYAGDGEVTGIEGFITEIVDHEPPYEKR